MNEKGVTAHEEFLNKTEKSFQSITHFVKTCGQFILRYLVVMHS